MNHIFYLSGAVAVLATLMVITRANAVHALLYLVVSLLSVAMVFVSLGAAFAAALEVIVYAGAIMVLFVFAVMMLDLGTRGYEGERRLISPRIWAGPAALAAVLLGELVYVVTRTATAGGAVRVGPEEVGRALFGRYMLGVELASMLLLAGLIAAMHLGRRTRRPPEDDR